ncbi:Phosphatidylinositol 4-phosphate 5-kinase 3 [Camellia lanceoleosa]|uniref:Phosphatidylinositol 4-phosphate 5-kinase 3 n=1 Tax=Camellia lanceoleosa TaxID=1840588 RepID=A0ACC0GCU5_9ERIC|nr:Phosphatidylinositol 4-phosphate 5-kinase 3 [Camellia lanceoleosa]
MNFPQNPIQTLSSVNEIKPDEEDRGTKAPQTQFKSPTNPVHPQFVAVLAGSPRFSPSSPSLFAPSSSISAETTYPPRNLLLALIFIVIALFFAGKNKGLIQQSFLILSKRLGFSQNNYKLVQWFIGESILSKKDQKLKRIVREGVEFYSNGDFYEGEFHKGRCNGSEVYNYFVNGRYEGDWVDERYDGYEIESWARGSLFRGQYRQGLRHGYGVYRFYTVDAYAGEWCNRQSHGVGMQSCSNGSSYVGEFKCGVKHGLDSYHFR